MSAERDLYKQAGGDAAWTLWFDKCSVHRVGEVNPAFATGLAAEIDSAMYGQLSKMGIPKESMNGDIPYLHFDSFFLADSSRAEAEMRKPLKQYYKDRLSTVGRPLKQLICGSIFSPGCGRIRDIARDWVCTVRGWKPHSLLGDDKKRHTVWDRAAGKDDASTLSVGIVYRFGTHLDRDALKTDIEDALSVISTVLDLEKCAVSLLFYAAAQGISLDNPIILDVLGCKKSTAYNLQGKCMELSDRIFREKDIATDDLMFARLLMRICEAYLDSKLIEQLIK